MRLGEAIYEDAELIRDNPVLTVPYNVPSTIDQCCYKLIVLAEDPAVTDPLRNDKSDWIWFYNNGFSGATMTLQKNIDGTWTDVRDLNDNTYGTHSVYGFFTNVFVEKGMGYYIDWQKVLTDATPDPAIPLGEGGYRIKATGTNIFGSEVVKYSWEYCLWKWTQDREEGTIKFEWNMNGRVGDPENDRKERDFGVLNRPNQIRLGGDFGRQSAPYESDYVHYQSETPGYGKEVYITNKFFNEYLVSLDPIPYYIHEFLKHDMMLGDELRITDFNTRNPMHLIQRSVRPATNWEPAWHFGNKLASVELKFEDLYRNAHHYRS